MGRRYANILETIGNTPVVKIGKLAPPDVNLFVKIEAFNPLGSVKDRLALGVIEAAEKSGELKLGQTVIEATSGNTGIGLAMVCAITTHGGRSEGPRNDLEVPIPPGLAVKGVVLPHQLRTIDCKARHSEKLCTVPRATLQATRSRLKVLLSL